MSAFGPCGLDYSAVIQLAEISGVGAYPIATALLPEMLPVTERAIIKGLNRQE